MQDGHRKLRSSRRDKTLIRPSKASNDVVSHAAQTPERQFHMYSRTPALIQDLCYGQVRLLLLRLFSPFCPRISLLTLFGSLAFAQHCIATLLMSSISSLSSFNCLFASLLFLSFTPFPSLWMPIYCRHGVVKLRFPPLKPLR